MSDNTVPKAPAKWHTIYRGNEDKCFFSGKDGKSGLARSEYDWRTTDSLSRESGLSKRRTEEIIDYYCKKNVIIQHSKDPEKWGYWERVGVTKPDPDPVKKDHDDRAQKQQNLNNGGTKKPGTGTGGNSTAPTTPKGGSKTGTVKSPSKGTNLPGKGTGTTSVPGTIPPPPVAPTPTPVTTLPAKVPAKPVPKRTATTPSIIRWYD